MKRKIAILALSLLFVAAMAIPAMAYERSSDAAVYTDFNAADGSYGVQGINCESGVIYLNGIADNTTFSIENGAAKMEMGKGGFVVLGQDPVQIRDANGKLQYKYLVIRMKGEVGNENRTTTGGLLLFIGGGDGSHAITLNDRPLGVAPVAQDANGQPMNAISTEWQEFVIALTETNVRVRNDGNPVTGLNINTVDTTATLYIDDIYFTNTVPETAAVYDPNSSTDAVGSDASEGGDAAGENGMPAGVELLDPPTAKGETPAPEDSSNLGLIVLIAGGAGVVLMAVLFAVAYVKIVKVKLK